ncbi:MAG: hypothetical protein JNL79_36465 [Myxococcales bacterium]|nr:hypothetical protein [Myxococcales bacterium]
MTALANAAPCRAQTILVERLEAAFDGDPGARIFLQAALRGARRATLPTDPETLLDFVRAHLLGPLTEELGGRAVVSFLDALERALRTPVSDVEVSADVELDDESLGIGSREESGEVCRPSRLPTALRPPPYEEISPRHTSSIPPSQRDSGAVRARLRALLIHGDRFTRAILARQLVAAGCDVTVIETFVDIASVVDALPDLAVVDLDVRDVHLLLAAMVTRNPGVRVLGLLPPGFDAEVLFGAAGVLTHETTSHAARSAEIATRLRALALR